MGTIVAVGGPRLNELGGGWDAWPLVGIVLTLWICRRVLRISWGVPLFIAAVFGSLCLPPAVHAWGVVPVAGIALGLAVVLRLGRNFGSAKGNGAV